MNIKYLKPRSEEEINEYFKTISLKELIFLNGFLGGNPDKFIAKEICKRLNIEEIKINLIECFL